MKIIASTLLIACLSVSAFGAAGHEHCSNSGWEVHAGLGISELTEKENGHQTEGTTLHLHATKGTDYTFYGYPVGFSIGAETFLDADINHHCLHLGPTIFLTDSWKLSFGPSIEYALHDHDDHHDEGGEDHHDEEGEDHHDEEGEDHHDEEANDWETEIGWYIETCACIYHVDNFSIGLYACYGETDHEEHTSIGINIGAFLR